MNRKQEKEFMEAMTKRLEWYEEIIDGVQPKFETCPDILNRHASFGNPIMKSLVRKHYKEIIQRLKRYGYQYEE